ncbi:MAG: hypothetical protein WAM05_10575 [Candidatus Binataceae bacterium]
MKDLREAINATIQGCSHYSLRGDPSLRQPPFRMTDKDVRLVHEYRSPSRALIRHFERGARNPEAVMLNANTTCNTPSIGISRAAAGACRRARE